MAIYYSNIQLLFHWDGLFLPMLISSSHVRWLIQNTASAKSHHQPYLPIPTSSPWHSLQCPPEHHLRFDLGLLSLVRWRHGAGVGIWVLCKHWSVENPKDKVPPTIFDVPFCWCRMSINEHQLCCSRVPRCCSRVPRWTLTRRYSKHNFLNVWIHLHASQV